MEKPITGKAWILEICPAPTLKVEGLYDRYKDENLNDDPSSVRATWWMNLTLKRLPIAPPVNLQIL